MSSAAKPYWLFANGSPIAGPFTFAEGLALAAARPADEALRLSREPPRAPTSLATRLGRAFGGFALRQKRSPK